MIKPKERKTERVATKIEPTLFEQLRDIKDSLNLSLSDVIRIGVETILAEKEE